MKKRRKHSEQEMLSLYDRYTTESIRLKDLLSEAKVSRCVFSRWRRKFDAVAWFLISSLGRPLHIASAGAIQLTL